MKKIILLISIGIILLIGCDKRIANISEIKVLDKEFNVIRIINQPEIISEANAIWMAKEKVELTKRPNFIYKIDIISDGRSTRWLYDSSGYTTILSKVQNPIYQIEEADKFNKIIIPYDFYESLNHSNVDSLYSCFTQLFESNYQKKKENYDFPFNKVTNIEIQHALIKKLRIEGFRKFNNLEKYGQGGGAYFHFVYWKLVAMLIKSDLQGDLVADLWDDKNMVWDGAAPLFFADIVVKEGKRMLPIINKFKTKDSAKKRMIDLIEKGIKTAI